MTIAASELGSPTEGWRHAFDTGVPQTGSAWTASDEKAHLQSGLAEWMMDCLRPGWDGYGAEPASKEAYAAAMSFVHYLPSGFKMPDVSVDPDGCFNFEWRRGPRRVILVAVHPDFTVHFAALFGAARMHGDEPFFNSLPSTLEGLLERLYSR